MPITQAFLEATLAKLGAARLVTYRKMFGGAGVYLDGFMFAVLDDDRVYFKVDDVNEGRYVEAGMDLFVYDPSKGATMPYREVPNNVWESSETLGEWIDASVEVVKRKKGGKKR